MLREALAPCLLLLVSTAAAVQPGAPDGRPRTIDARFDRGSVLATAGLLRAGVTSTEQLIAGPAAEPGELRLAALRRLELESGGAIVARWSKLTGSPSLLFAREGFLTAPDARPAETVAREFLERHSALFALSPGEAAALALDAAVPVSAGTVLHFGQRIAGLPVDHGHLAAVVAEDGRVLALAGGLVAGGRLDPRPRLDPVAAADTLARLVGVAQSSPELIERDETTARLRLEGFARPELLLELVAFPTAWGPRLAWSGRLDAASNDAAWELLVDDRTGRVLRVLDLARHADTRGRVFEENPDKSPHELERFIDRDDYRDELSLLGWADDDQTTGNNTTARLDRDADNEMTPGRLATAAPAPPYLAFDFPYTADPVADVDSAITQLFYGVNWAHDRMLSLGFDEASGNYQAVNQGFLGVGGDPVLADAQDGAVDNNAQFIPDLDGRSGRMQMGVWDTPLGQRDSSFDMGVVIHEYLHGVTTRVVGGPGSVGCLGLGQDGAMGEGWSDFFPASFFDDTIIGAWISGQPGGIRMFALDDNPATGKDYRDYCTAPYMDALGGCEVHANGEIWSGFLWKVREGFVALYGDEGKRRMEQLVFDALKLTPCAPSMLDARDALILADRMSNGGAHECLIKTEAAGRWMGLSASSNGAGDQEPIAADDNWPECVDAGTVAFLREPADGFGPLPIFACEDLMEVVVVDGNAVGPVPVTITTPGGDSETIDLAAGVDPASFTGSIAVAQAMVMPGDGTLQIAPGETVTVSYDDQDPLAPQSAQALVSCAPQLTILSHQLRDSNCDEDTVPGFPNLPGFLDAGEAADLVLRIANHQPVAIEGLLQVTTDRPDLVQILDVNPRVSFPAAEGPTYPGVVEFIVKLAAEQDFMGATELDILFGLVATGYDSAETIAQTLRLDLDYQLEQGLTIADGAEGETGGPVGPEWTTGTLEGGNNDWTLVSCHASEGVQSYRNGPSNCNGNHEADQALPYLSFPQLDFGAAGAEAARITNVSFQHDVDLFGGTGQFGVLGADAVALVVTEDPSALDTSNPLTLLASGLSAYANLPDFGFDSNTNGFEPQSIDVPPEALPELDQRQPFFLTWLLWPDVLAPPFFGDGVGEGYYVDEVVITYDRVVAIPSAAVCLADDVVVSRPEFQAPPSAMLTGSTCAGDAVQVSAAGSGAVRCLLALDYRFLIDGTPIACFADDTGGLLRTQDMDGWGNTSDCWHFPMEDTVYEVEVRCQNNPLATDLRTLPLRVLDGLPLLDAAPAGFCPDAPAPVMLDASESALVGCPGARQYRFLDEMGGELDCDGDGNPDGWVADPLCEIAGSMVDTMVTIELGCDALPGCTLSSTVTVPALDIQPDAAELAPPGTIHCALADFSVTAAGTIVNGCNGSVEYRWTDGAGWDTGWTSDPDATTSLAADGTLNLEVRCDALPDCTQSATVDIEIRDGTVSLASDADPMQCAGEPITLTLTEDTPVQCATGTVEYRFLADPDGSGFVLLDCDGDGMADDWGASTTCDTAQVDGGADFVAEARCSDDPGCSFGSASVAIAPMTGIPTGDPPGTLLITRSGDCPAGPIDVILDWSDSGRMPQAFVVLRGEDPSALADRFDVDATTYTDAGLSCSDPARVPWQGADVLFYLFVDRNTCTGDPIFP